MMELAKSFEPQEIEQRWYPIWESAAISRSGEDVDHPPYCIQLPPPNVTGTLHMGHAFQQTLMDALIRYHRMRGFAIPTGWSAPTTPASPRRSWSSANWKPRARPGTTSGARNSSNASGNGSSNRARPSPGRCAASATPATGLTPTPKAEERLLHHGRDGCRAPWSKCSCSLHEEGLIYRGKRLVNWDPVLGTAVSDLEVDSEEEDGRIWEIRYPLPKAAAVWSSPPRGRKPCSATSPWR